MQLKPHTNSMGSSIGSVEKKDPEFCENRHITDSKETSLLWYDTLNVMNESVVIMDADHRIQKCNQAMVQLVGKPESEIIGQYC